MLTYTLTQTGAGSSAPASMNIHGRPEVSLQVVVSGTVDYTVQQTLDDPGSSPTWFNHPDVNLVGATGDEQGNYAYIPRAVRLTVNSGDGTATLKIIQAGIIG